MAELYTERDGRELAVQMLHELMHAGADVCAIESKYRDGTPQFDAFARYLAILRDRQSAELDAGFAAILTDALGIYLDGGDRFDSLIEAK